MERVEGEKTIKELFDKFNLSEILLQQDMNGEICPLCKTNLIVTRYNKRQRKSFYGCSGYPKCTFTANIAPDGRTASREKLRTEQQSSRKQKIEKPKEHRVEAQQTNQEWETKLCYWSKQKKPGYKFSQKKNAWYKEKNQR